MSLPLRSFVAATLAGSLAFAIPAAASAEAGAATALTGSALARFPDFAALPDSNLLALPVMLQGTLSDLGGKPLSGAQVLVAAWPSNDAVHALPRGGEFDIIPLARTTAGRNGAYELRSLLTPLLATLVGQDGLDIELDVFHGERHYVYLSQVRMDGTAWVRDVVNGVDGQASSTVEAAAANLLDLALDPAKAERLNASAPSSKWPPPRAEGEPPFTKRDKPFPGVRCTRYKLVSDPKNPPRAMTTVATAVARNGPTIKTTYTQGAETVSSTGVSFDGGVSFSINGARQRTLTTGAGFVGQAAKSGRVVAREYKAEIAHEVVRRVCLGNNEHDYRVQYTTAPTLLTGGVEVVKTPGKPWVCLANNTAPARGAEYVSTDDHKAATYGAAFSFKPLGGASFGGSAQSGYSDQVKVEFYFSDSKGGQWCGDHGFPAQDGQRVQAFEK